MTTLRYLLARLLALPVDAMMAVRERFDTVTGTLLRAAYQRLDRRGHCLAFGFVRCAVVAVRCAFAYATIPLEEAIGAVALWVLGYGWQGALLRESAAARLEWYALHMLPVYACGVVREATRGRQQW